MTHPPDFKLRLKNTPRIHYCEPWWRWSPPPLPDYDLWYVMEGEGTMRLLHKSVLLHPGICFVLPPGSEPVAAQDPRHRLQVFAVHFEPLNEQGSMLSPEDLGLVYQGNLLQDKAFFDTLARRCAASAEREGDALSHRQTALFVEQMLLHLFEEAARPAMNPLDVLIREIHGAIRAAPGEQWSLTEQADRACLSRSQYTRRFSQLFGVAPLQFVIQCRLERAAQLLAETDMTVGEVAEVLGYRDLFFFSRQFKGHSGMSPGMLRRSRS